MLRAILILGGCYLAGLAIAMIRLSTSTTPQDTLVIALFYLWNAAPVIAAGLVARQTRRRALRRMMLIFVAGFPAFAALAIGRAFMGVPDAQSGLIFVWLPVIGWMALAFAALIAAMAIMVSPDRRPRRNTGRRAGR